MTTVKLLAFLLISTSLQATKAIQINCRLEWERFLNGDILPDNAVASHTNEYFIARTFDLNLQRHHIGIFEYSTGRAFIHNGIYTAFEILTNPYDCDLQWVSIPYIGSQIAPMHSWPINSDATGTISEEYVARIFVNSYWIAGSASLKTGEFHLSDSIKNVYVKQKISFEQELTEFQILRSFSSGLEIFIENFTIAEDPAPPFGIDYLGMDIIRNDADVYVTHTVTHRKTVEERFGWGFEIETAFQLAASIAVSVGLEIPIFRIYVVLGLTIELHWENGNKFERLQQRELVVSRKITVPPRQSVQVCSLARIWNSVRSDFNATAIYKGKGMSGMEVYKLLVEQDSDFKGEIAKDFVRSEVSGVISKSTVVTTEIIVLPADSMKDCDAYAEDGMISAIERQKAWNEVNKWVPKWTAKKFKKAQRLTYQPDERTESKFVGLRSTED